MVHFNTRKNACLDLLLTNRPTFVDNCLPQPGFGDHDTSILADILCHPQKIKPTQRTIPCWNRADIDSLKEAIKSGMNDLVTSESAQTPVNELWIKLKNIITDAQQQYVPTKQPPKDLINPGSIMNVNVKFVKRSGVSCLQTYQPSKGLVKLPTSSKNV